MIQGRSPRLTAESQVLPLTPDAFKGLSGPLRPPHHP